MEKIPKITFVKPPCIVQGCDGPVEEVLRLSHSPLKVLNVCGYHSIQYRLCWLLEEYIGPILEGWNDQADHILVGLKMKNWDNQGEAFR